MKFQLVEVNNLSGKKATIYSIKLDGEKKNYFEKFISENFLEYKNEVSNIANRLRTIGHKTGAVEGFFKQKEGTLGDLVCALYDMPNSNLRLYCVRFGHGVVVLGSGGLKPKNIRALQESEKLEEENYIVRFVSEKLCEALRTKQLRYNADYTCFEGDFNFE